MKGTRPLLCWTVPEVSWKKPGSPSKSHLPPREQGTFSPRTRPVAAGFDRFAPALIEQYLGGYAEKKLGITLHDLLALGRQNPNDSSENFNMAYLAIPGERGGEWCESLAWESQPTPL